MKRLIKISGISSIAFFWLFFSGAVVTRLIDGNMTTIGSVDSAAVFVFILTELDRRAAFRLSLGANTFSLLIWGFLFVALSRALLIERGNWSVVLPFSAMVLFACWKTVTAIVIYVTVLKERQMKPNVSVESTS